MDEDNKDEGKIFGQWVRASGAGWALGIPCIVALALLGEAVGIGGLQFIVGAGMGVSIGFMQGRVIRRLFNKFAPWFWSNVVGLAAPFLVIDLSNKFKLGLGFSLYISVAVSGLIVGVWQALILRSRFRNAAWWAAGSVVGWFLSSGTAGLADWLFQSRSIRGIPGLLAYLGCLVVGGLILGLVTGAVLVRLLRREPAA